MKSVLHNMNPSVKFIVVTLSILMIALFFNPWTPLLFFFGIVLLQFLFSRINWKLWFIFMLPFTFTALGYLWTTVVFAADTGGTVIWSYGTFNVTDEQWARALSLAFRVLAFSALSLLFAFTTDPVAFILSLMQQLKLSPKLAYGILAGYQFLPVLKDELHQIRLAHRLRGAEQEKHWWQRLVSTRRLLIPMLAGAVRKAERTAFAMEARGFTGEPRTVFYRQMTISKTDGWITGLFFILLVLSCSAGSFLI